MDERWLSYTRRTRTRAATNTRAFLLLGKSSWLRLIPVVRKEAKGAPGLRGDERESGTYKMKTRSEMIKLRIFLAYAGIKGEVFVRWNVPVWMAERLDRVSFIYGQYHRNMVSFKNHRAPPEILLRRHNAFYTALLYTISFFYFSLSLFPSLSFFARLSITWDTHRRLFCTPVELSEFYSSQEDEESGGPGRATRL